MNDPADNRTPSPSATTRTARTVNARRRRGFTLVELMVVVTILLMAFGLMIPSLTEFMKNRELDSVMGEVTSLLSTARMQAVVNGHPFLVVFFREGPRIYDTGLKRWRVGERFDPARAAMASPKIHFDLFFAGRHSDELPRYTDWQERLEKRAESQGRGRARRGPANELTFSVDDLPAVAFERDGTAAFRSGGSEVTVDVSSAKYKKDEGADIVIWQQANAYAALIDVQATGSVKSKVVLAEKIESRRKTAEPGS